MSVPEQIQGNSMIERIHRELLEFPAKFKSGISETIVGQDEVLDLLILSLFCNGHVLLTGVPGLAKTLLINTLAQLFHLRFNRIQCTPDLMPSDITGVEVLEEAVVAGTERRFRFIQGPVFTNLLLADEINRTSPRTQAALLQAMQERQVTVAGRTYVLDDPFIVFATQNPIDSEGTYPLPEAQLDRFLFNIEISYPEHGDEMRIADKTIHSDAAAIDPIFEPELLKEFQSLVDSLPMGKHLIEWVVRFVRATRPAHTDFEEIKQFVEWGAGVRASQNIVRAARARALLDGAHAVRFEHVLPVLTPILRHRIILNFAGEAEQWSAERVVELLLERLPAP